MISVSTHIQNACLDFATSLGRTDIDSSMFVVDVTKDMSKGDLYTNFALAAAGKMEKNPMSIAVDLGVYLDTHLDKTLVEKVEVVGGYVNFWIVVSDSLEIPEKISHPSFAGKKVAYEYTDPNPMKEFHIGHLMANTIGESMSRLGELAGAEVKRYSYQGDVGRHIAVTLWGVRFLDANWPEESVSITDKVKFLGSAYVAGNAKLAELKSTGEENEEYLKAVKEIEVMNQKVYDRTDEEVNVMYDQGREWSLEKFEELYDILGTKFDYYFFESITGPIGRDLVLQNIKHFARGENNAVIFEGEKFDMHTRVFINSKGLPTYEAKEIGLAKVKYDVWAYDKSFVITANEQKQALDVTLTAIKLVLPEIGNKNEYIFNGMMKFANMKMSSRTGKIIAGDELVYSMMDASLEKMKDREMSEGEKKTIARDVAVAAIKFTILKQNFRKDIIFDQEKSLALEGDSGPYIQYTAVRIQSVLKKVKDETTTIGTGELSKEALLLKRTLYRFEHVCLAAIDESAPQHIAQYLIDLASKFNGFYTNNKIITESVDSRLVGLCEHTLKVLEKGLWTLGIRTVEKM
ncbi:MAG: arginine--tRNA ligase [Patescibacteria group bacterium]